MEIALLACFCAIHNHGFHMLFSFSAIVQHFSCTPVGFSILKAGLNKSVLLSVYASKNARSSREHASSGIFLSLCLVVSFRWISNFNESRNIDPSWFVCLPSGHCAVIILFNDSGNYCNGWNLFILPKHPVLPWLMQASLYAVCVIKKKVFMLYL